MSPSKKTRFITFMKFMTKKVMPPYCGDEVNQNEIETAPQRSTYFRDFQNRVRERNEMKQRKAEVEIESSEQCELLITLPDHLIVDHILPRLPVKSVLRFKSVCKSWHSAISHPKFAESHCNCSSFRPQLLLFEDYDSTNKLHMHLLHYDKNKHDIRDLVSLPFVDDGRYPSVDLVGSCNGLLCLFLMELSGSFLVWNPAIRQHRNIPDPYYQELVMGYGFGYAPSVDDYKIVASYSSVLHSGAGCFFVYSSKAEAWKRIRSLDGSPYAGELTRFRGVWIGDRLYWPIRHSKSIRIVGFDLVEETLKEVPGMDWTGEYDDIVIFGIDGGLSLCCYRCEDVCDVWMLKQHGAASTWEMLYSVDLEGISNLSLNKTGKYLVHHKGKLEVHNPSHEAVDKFQEGVDFDGKVMDTCDYVDTLVSPFGLTYYHGHGRGRR